MRSCLSPAQLIGIAEAKLDCGPVTNKSNDLPRTVAIGTNPAGTGAHALASGLAAVASKTTPVGAKVQPYNGPNAWMPLFESGEIEMGIINILDSNMAATGTGNYKKPYPVIRIVSGGVFPIYRGPYRPGQVGYQTDHRSQGQAVGMGLRRPRDQPNLAKRRHGNRGLKATDVVQVRVSNLNDGVRAVPEGKVDASFTAVGIGVVEEANAMEPMRFSACRIRTRRTKSWTATAPRW